MTTRILGYCFMIGVGLASIGASAGCSETAPAGEASAEQGLAATRPDQQLVPWVPRATIDGLIASFRERNGDMWASDENPAARLVASVGSMERTDAVGPAVPLTEEQSIATGRAFLVKNADLLGLSPEDAKGMKVAEVRVAWDRSLMGVDFALNEAPFPVAIQGASHVITTVIYSDGEVRGLRDGSYDGRRYPPLTLDPAPAHPASAPSIGGQLVGTPLGFTRTVCGPTKSGPSFVEETIPLDPIGPADLAGRLIVYPRSSSAGVLLTLAYRFDVSRRNGSFRFDHVIDSRTGEKLEEPPTLLPYGGIDLSGGCW